MTPAILPDLSFQRHGATMTIEARVAAAPPRAMQWTLLVRSHLAGGENAASQSGTTTGAGSDAFASVSLDARASGRATLVVRGGGMVAQRDCDFAPDGDRCAD